MAERHFLTRFCAATFAVICGILPAFASESLDQVLLRAFETNPTIHAERARQRATGELKAQAWANALPQISAAGSYQNVETTTTFASPDIPFPTEADFSPLTTQVQGQLTLFNGFRNVNQIRQAAARVRAGGAQLAAVEQDVLLQVATAYFDVVRDRGVYEANVNNVDVLVSQQKEAQLRFDVGELTRTDLAQAAARLAGARAQLTTSQASLSISRARFAELTGGLPGTLDDNPSLPPAPESREAALAQAAILAPPVLAARANEESSRKQIAIAKSVFTPDVALTSSYQYSDEPSAFTATDEQFSYGVRATIPIFQGGLNFSRVREARALNDADRRRVEEAERRTQAIVTSAWEQLQAANANIVSAKAQREANELALQGVLREAQLGARTTLDVLNAEQEYLNAEVALANATRDARVALFSLLSGTGLLTIETVARTNHDADVEK